MLTDHEIETLIRLPKDIVSKTPVVGYKNENRSRRCELELMARSSPSPEFTVFIRQNDKFIENFSIGLRYKTKDRTLGTITMVRTEKPAAGRAAISAGRTFTVSLSGNWRKEIGNRRRGIVK